MKETSSSAWPAATVHRDGMPVACWFAVERLPDRTAFHAFTMSRAAGGTSDNFVFEPGTEDHVAEALSSGLRPPGSGLRPSPFLTSFGDGLLVLAEIVRMASGTAGDPFRFDPTAFMLDDDPETACSAARDVSEATSAFVETLDADMLERVRLGTWECGVPDGCWWGFDETFGRGAPAKRALERWPHLSRCVTVAFGYHREGFASASDGGATAVAGAIPKGMPVRWVARNLDAIEAAHSSNVASLSFRGDPHALDRTLTAAGLVPATSLPRVDDIAAFLRCAAAVSNVSWVDGVEDMKRHLRLGANWALFESALDKACGGYRPAVAVRGVEDMLSSFKRQVLSPALHLAAMGGVPSLPEAHGRAAAVRAMMSRETVKSTVAAAALLSGRSLVRCVRDSVAWHAGLHRISDRLASLPGTLGKPSSWSAILPDHEEGDIALVVLTDAPGLADEGRDGRNADGTEGLGHCVGGYATKCTEGGTRIASLRRLFPDGGFARLSTAQLAVVGGRVVARQHSGKENHEPPAEAAAVLESYLASLAATGTFDEETIPRHPASGDDPCSPAGYDWFVPGNLEAAIEAWAPFIPRGLRRMTLSGWAELEEWAHCDGMPAWRRLPFRSGGIGR